jgi:PTS system N-acetylgalactosamine-specific IIA component
MVKLIITGHGKFSNGMFDAINFIMGAQKDIVNVEFGNIDLDTYSNQIEDIIKNSEQGTLIFTDLIGGTPFRISTLLCTKYDNVYVITGTNIPMIIESIIRREGMPLKELAAQIINTGKDGIQIFDRQLIKEKSKNYK